MNNQKVLISVIIPVYNVEKYLRKCINSILNQTYKNLEIILVDDGSPDKCGKICDEYREKDLRVHVIHKENGGLSDARNIGIKNATGKYIVFIDSDDWIHPNMIEILFYEIQKSNADISMCMFKYIYEDEMEKNIDTEYHINSVEILTSEEVLERYYSDSRVPYVVAWNKLYKRDLFQKICYPKGKIHEDEFTTYKLFYDAEKIIVVDAELYFYLQRCNSITGGSSKVKHWDILDAYSESKDYYKVHKESKLLEMVRIKETQEIMNLYSNLYINRKDEDFVSKKRYLKKRYAILFRYIITKGNLKPKYKMESILFRISPDGYSFIKMMLHKHRR